MLDERYDEDAVATGLGLLLVAILVVIIGILFVLRTEEMVGLTIIISGTIGTVFCFLELGRWIQRNGDEYAERMRGWVE